MKNDNIFSDSRWDEIVEYAFSEDAPSPEFSEGYIRRRERLISSVRPRHKRVTMGAVIAVAAAVCLPVTVYAAGKVIQIRAEQSAEYQRNVVIEQAETPESGAVSGNFEGYRQLKINYVPEGLVLREDGKYHEPGSEKAMTPLLYRYDESKGISEFTNFSTGSEVVEAEGKSAVFIERARGYDQLWVLFNGTPYVAEIYVNDVPMDEVQKLAEGLELIPAETETAGIWQYNSDTDVLPDSGSAYSNNVDMSRLSTLSAGDSFEYWYNEELDIRVDDITVQKSFDGITTDSIGNYADFGEYPDEKGGLTAERVTVRLGDGVNTLDEELSRETVSRSVIVVTLTCKNSGAEQREVCFCPEMFRIADGKAIDLTWPEDNIEVSYGDKTLGCDGGHFSFYTSGAHEKNSAVVGAGESVQVRLAFIADDDYLDTLYINFGETSDNPAAAAENSSALIKVTE